MLDIAGYLVLIIQLSILISFFTFVPTMLIYRIIVGVKYKRNIKEIALISLLPFSFGYFYYLKDNEQSKAYKILLIIYLSLTCLGISFTLFQRLF